MVKKIGDVLLSPTYRTINTITGSTDGPISILGEYPTGLFNDLETIVLNLKSAMNSAITLIPLSSSVFDLLEFADPKVDSYDEIFKDEITFIVNQSLDSLVENKQIKDVENARNEVITVIDKTNFLVTYGHDIQISGLTYTKANLTDFNSTTFYNQFKPAITYLKSASAQNVLELEPTNPNFTELTLSFNSEDLKSILSILLIGKKDTIVQQFARNPLMSADDIGNVSSMLDSFIYKEPTLILGEENRLNIILGPFPVRPNDKPIEFEISSTEEMTDEPKRFVANNIFINKNKLGTTLNFYKP